MFEKREWVKIAKGTTGRGGSHNQNLILISQNQQTKRKYTNLRIAIPIAILKSAGIALGDYVTVSYCKDFCEVERTNEINIGFRLSGKTRQRKPCIAMRMTPLIKETFFPNGRMSYTSSLHKVRPNIVQFSIGKDA